ncbi:hypothetical protein, partial [Kocuria turfanensis]|uniref:hypothetical protein n=1 Tax=Kocuria turfanensis TaxID=388357 RepID=UPI0018DCE04E
ALARRERLRRWEDTARDVLTAIGRPLARPDAAEHTVGHAAEHAPGHDAGHAAGHDTATHRTRRPS